MSALLKRLIPRSKRIRLALLALVFLIAALALAGYLYERNRTGSIYHPHARFVPQPTPTLPKTRRPTASPGRSTATPRTTPASSPRPPRVRPPFKQLWVHNDHALLEFPPVIYGEPHLPARRRRAC